MKKWIALFLISALLVLCLPAFTLAENPVNSANENIKEVTDTDDNSASIDIKATATPCNGLSENVLYFTIGWEREHAVYYRSRNYTWDADELKYVEATLPDWTCIRNYAQLVLNVSNYSNVPLTVTESWEAGEAISTDYWDGTARLQYKLNDAESFSDYSEAFEIPSAASGDLNVESSVQTAELLARVELAEQKATVAAADLSAGTEVFGTVTISISDATEM